MHKRRSEFLQQYSIEANQMLDVLKKSLQRLVTINQTMQSKVPQYKLKGLVMDQLFLSKNTSQEVLDRIKNERRKQAQKLRQRKIMTGKEPSFQMYEETSSSEVEEENEYQGDLIEFGDATNKFRHIVAKHFLSKSVR